ncbi:LOW QUALITY PROTEIN: hypothetical protein TorRG33x02_157970 [Trema orientale]|uniref:Uncharacterized protein n=1 Tax=Trema orientale TaxID=63057 RepID=A0A2P5ESA9_TREOI|nr:LOW QUALITY PROTEIN: hypothetical protein TorRG33x02_157970 [Trema orientale]
MGVLSCLKKCSNILQNSNKKFGNWRIRLAKKQKRPSNLYD